MRGVTKRLATIGAVLSAIVFITTLTRPASASDWPPLAAAAANAAVAFIWVWVFLPVVAYLGSLGLKAVGMALRWATRPMSSTSLAEDGEQPRFSGDIPAR